LAGSPVFIMCCAGRLRMDTRRERMVQIRPHMPGDQERLIELWRHFFPDPSEHKDPTQAIQRMLSIQPGLFFSRPLGRPGSRDGQVRIGWAPRLDLLRCCSSGAPAQGNRDETYASCRNCTARTGLSIDQPANPYRKYPDPVFLCLHGLRSRRTGKHGEAMGTKRHRDW
jgi:hypothetical protein